MENVMDSFQHTVKNWWVSLLLGILYVIVAAWLLFSPFTGYVALSIVFSFSMLFSGILELFFSLANRKKISSWGWLFAGGIIDFILGVFLIAYPFVSMDVIPYIVAFWLMFRGFSAIGTSIDLQRYKVKNWGWYLAFGIIALLSSFLVLWHPLVGAFSVVYMISFAFLFVGITRISLSIAMKGMRNKKEE